MTHLQTGVWEKAYTYADYRQIIDDLMAQGKTTGDKHDPDMLEYTRMNTVRMNRLDKSSKLEEEVVSRLGDLQRPMHWLTITEGWCGDAALIVPVIEQMAEACPQATHKLILRDEHLDIMDAFLTDGGRAIPIVIILDAHTHEVLGHWGPRPAGAQRVMVAAKERMAQAAQDDAREAIFHEVKVDLQKWYAADKSHAIQSEFLDILTQVAEEVH